MTKEKLKTKNILYITHTYNNFIKSQVEEISKSFNHVYVLVRHKPITELARFKFLSRFIFYQDIKYHSKEYKFDLTNLPKNITVIPVSVWYLPFSDWFYRKLGVWHYKAVKKVIEKKKIRFDMVHAHMLWSAGYVGKRISEDFKVPLVVTGHGTDVYKTPFKSKFWRQSITEVLKIATEIITVSQNNMRKIKELGIKKKVHVIPNGFDMEKFKERDKKVLRKELGLPIDKKIFLTVANLELVKGHKFLVEAVKDFVKKHKDVYFIFVGGGSQYTSIQSLIKKEKLEGYIKMTNFMPLNNVIKYELASDYFVLPSLNEGIPTVMFEALASGLPLISTKVGGIPEVAREFSAILVNPESSKDLEFALENALKRKWDVKKMKEYSKQFSWENISSKIVDVYITLFK